MGAFKIENVITAQGLYMSPTATNPRVRYRAPRVGPMTVQYLRGKCISQV